MSDKQRESTAAQPASREGEDGRTWTLGQVLKWTQGRFVKAGLDSPRLDAELLLCHALGKPRMALYTGYDQQLAADELLRYRELIRRRLSGESVAYLIGRRDFWSLTLKVSSAVLVPRPETEVLVEVALALLRRDEAAGPDETAGATALAATADRQVPAEPGGELTVHYDEPAWSAAGEDEEGEVAEAAATEGAAGEMATEAAAGTPAGEAAAGTPAGEAAAGTPAGEAAAGTPAGEAAPPTQAAVTDPGADGRAPARPLPRGRKRPGAAPAPDATGAGPLIADIGTGSGAVALALKKERPDARVLAVDQSPTALAVAADNAACLGLAVEFHHGDLLSPLHGVGRFDLIVSNPPYIPSADIAGLPAEVRGEPHAALDGGPDGLVLIRRLVDGARALLCVGGALAMEVGAGQSEEVADLMRAAGYGAVAVTNDLARIGRVVAGRWPG